jgi:hypothetical protein
VPSGRREPRTTRVPVEEEEMPAAEDVGIMGGSDMRTGRGRRGGGGRALSSFANDSADDEEMSGFVRSSRVWTIDRMARTCTTEWDYYSKNEQTRYKK